MIQIKPYDPYSRLCTSINCPSRFCNHSPHFHSKGSNRISYPLSLCPFLSGSRYTIHAPCFCLLTLAPSNEIEESNQFSLGLCEKVTKSYFNRLLGLRLLGLYVLLLIFASKNKSILVQKFLKYSACTDNPIIVYICSPQTYT